MFNIQNKKSIKSMTIFRILAVTSILLMLSIIVIGCALIENKEPKSLVSGYTNKEMLTANLVKAVAVQTFLNKCDSSEFITIVKQEFPGSITPYSNLIPDDIDSCLMVGGTGSTLNCFIIDSCAVAQNNFRFFIYIGNKPKVLQIIKSLS